MRAHRRLVNFAGFAVCAGLLAYALYSQFHLGLDPCPLCIFQRIGIALLGVVFLAAALHDPPGRGAFGYALLIAAATLATLAVAARHVYVQSLPPGSLPSCGAPLATRTHSLTLWIEAFTTLSSTTSAPRGAMKRPSDVPPPVDSVGRTPVTCATASPTAAHSRPGAV
ncbi:MAG: disulfide bond formation protein B [Gammaproteobacteria bacterium]|nr:MAG: disulfide bond formation protein B [Gammaproteobacteria bacterium]